MGPLRRDQYVFCDSHDQVLQRKTVRLVGTMEALWSGGVHVGAR